MSDMFNSNAISQFENANELRSYPFKDGASLVSRDGKELPLDVVSDLHLVVPFGGECKVVVSSVRLSPEMVSICVSAVSDGAVVAALSAIVSRGSFSPYTPYRLEKLAGVEDCGGIVTFGNFDFPNSPETYFFEDAEVCDGCVSRFSPPRLRAFLDPRSGELIKGDVKIDFSGHVDASREGKSIRLSLREGSSDELVSSCAKQMAANPCGATPIMSINGVMPDSQGRIVLWFH